ncbi:unnamed protein product [Boreogadus saida]
MFDERWTCDTPPPQDTPSTEHAPIQWPRPLTGHSPSIEHNPSPSCSSTGPAPQPRHTHSTVYAAYAGHAHFTNKPLHRTHNVHRTRPLLADTPLTIGHTPLPQPSGLLSQDLWLTNGSGMLAS